MLHVQASITAARHDALAVEPTSVMSYLRSASLIQCHLKYVAVSWLENEAVVGDLDGVIVATPWPGPRCDRPPHGVHDRRPELAYGWIMIIRISGRSHVANGHLEGGSAVAENGPWLGRG